MWYFIKNIFSYYFYFKLLEFIIINLKFMLFQIFVNSVLNFYITFFFYIKFFKLNFFFQIHYNLHFWQMKLTLFINWKLFRQVETTWILIFMNVGVVLREDCIFLVILTLFSIFFNLERNISTLDKWNQLHLLIESCSGKLKSLEY